MQNNNKMVKEFMIKEIFRYALEISHTENNSVDVYYYGETESEPEGLEIHYNLTKVVEDNKDVEYYEKTISSEQYSLEEIYADIEQEYDDIIGEPNKVAEPGNFKLQLLICVAIFLIYFGLDFNFNISNNIIVQGIKFIILFIGLSYSISTIFNIIDYIKMVKESIDNNSER